MFGPGMREGKVIGQFVHDIAEIDGNDARRFGGKATGLAKMAGAGLPIPPAFVIGTEGFRAFREGGNRLPEALLREVKDAMQRLEGASGKTFARGDRPLLVSVRSGAAISMPGMMDTVLNLGLDAAGAARLCALTGSRGFAVDTWLRFWRMYADTVLAIDPLDLATKVETLAEAVRSQAGAASFEDLEAAIVAAVRDAGEEPDTEPGRQLERAICAVFQSWDSPRAKAYRKHHGIADDLGTAVTVQAMVFGNLDADSGSGVAFTRNPNTGEPALYGEYLTGRQGEDLVAGTHTPADLADPRALPADLRDRLIACGRELEAIYRDAVDIEFTVESSRLFLLQVRPAKRTAEAAVAIAVAGAEEGLMSHDEALKRVSTEQLSKLLRPVFDEAELHKARQLAQGLGSSPGHAHGRAVLDSDRAAEHAAQGEAVILLRPTTSPQDIRGMLAATGIVTAKGGALSHAAVVSRALDKPCIVGCEALAIDLESRRFSVDGEYFEEGTPVSMDGTSGKLYAGALPLSTIARHGTSVARLLAWADSRSGAEIWPSPSASGIGEAAQMQPAGIGVIGLTDLLIASNGIDPFIARLGDLGQDRPAQEPDPEVSELVRRACLPALSQSDGLPIHIRLPRLGSDRARRMVTNWVELPAALFLPLGVPAYHASILHGMAAAARETGHDQVTALIAGITDARELQVYCAAVVNAGSLGAGAMIQNVAALRACRDMFSLQVPLWIEINEIIRAMYGFPSEILDVQSAMGDYVAAGHVACNPLVGLGAPLADLIEPLAADDNASFWIGVDCNGCSRDLVLDLFRRGFRRFAVSIGRRDETRLAFGQLARDAFKSTRPERL